MTVTVEVVVDGRPLTLASRDVDVASLESAGGWSLLTVRAVAPAVTLRVLVRVAPAEAGPRGGAVKFDDAFLRAVPRE